MLKHYGIPAIFIFFTWSCTSTKNNTNSSANSLPLPDSLNTSDLLFLSPEKQLQYFQNISNLLPTNQIDAGNKKYKLTESTIDLSGFSFTYKDTLRSLDDYIKETNVVGMIIIRNDSVLFEQYRQGTGPTTRWINFSVTKSVVSLLYGAALQDGFIKSLDEKLTQFIPELSGSVYDSVSLRNVLQMSSGVAWIDDPKNPQSDLVKVGKLEKDKGWNDIVAYLSTLKRAAPPGEKFNYNTIETSLAGLALKKIIGKPLATYLSEKIWKPFGMNSDGNWVKSRSTNNEIGGCCISATLRDYALLGLFAMKNGLDLNNKPMLPVNWMKESTSPAKSYSGYGYYWWLHPDGSYFASGSFGQQIEINPSQNVVIAIQSYWPTAFNNYYVGYMDSMLESLMKRLKSNQ